MSLQEMLPLSFPEPPPGPEEHVAGEQIAAGQAPQFHPERPSNGSPAQADLGGAPGTSSLTAAGIATRRASTAEQKRRKDERELESRRITETEGTGPLPPPNPTAQRAARSWRDRRIPGTTTYLPPDNEQTKQL